MGDPPMAILFPVSPHSDLNIEQLEKSEGCK